jgi:hypothetical protein
VRGEQREVRREEQPTAEVAERPGPGGDAVALVGLGDIRQKRVVDHDRRPEREVRDHEEQPAEQIR